jgi:hypothetical protein
MEIARLVQALPTIEVSSSRLQSECGGQILSLLLPLIKIKNYKSQIPFPVTVFDAIERIVELKSMNTNTALDKAHRAVFVGLIGIEGFQLPTVSAIFHFCHPFLYPIVDKNIQAACSLLSQEYHNELDGLVLPLLPAATTLSKNKLEKYEEFILFLTRLKELHNKEFNTTYDYRSLDKALMVYGVDGYKIAADENVNLCEDIV